MIFLLQCRVPVISLFLIFDYRKLNKVLIGNSYPNINDILASIQGTSVVSVLDLKSGYYQLPVRPEDRCKTAFVCHRGLFEFNVLPFGLSNAPSAFQETMVLMLGDALNRFAIALTLLKHLPVLPLLAIP